MFFFFVTNKLLLQIFYLGKEAVVSDEDELDVFLKHSTSVSSI